MTLRRWVLAGFPLATKMVTGFDCTPCFSRRHQFVIGVWILRRFALDRSASPVGSESSMHSRCSMKCRSGISALKLAGLPKFPLSNMYRYYGAVPDGGGEGEDTPLVGRRKKPFLVGRKKAREAREALMDYLYLTRGLEFADAEHISKNSPRFLSKLVRKAGGGGGEVGPSIRKFFLYHRINEYEPFFESLGVGESELDKILPHDSMLLSDDETLLRSFHLLCNYGVPRRRIGKIYMEAPEVFAYEPVVLMARLKAYEKMGFSAPNVAKLVCCCPSLLRCGATPGKAGGANEEACDPSLVLGSAGIAFANLLAELESAGIGGEWIGDNISPERSYDWSHIVLLMNFLHDLGIDRKGIGSLLRKHPSFLVESGNMVFSVVALLSKLGCSKKDLLCLFTQFPDSSLPIFLTNMRKGLSFLIEAGMPQEDSCRILRSDPHVFGCSSVKTAKSVLSLLNVGRERLCAIILDDPYQLLNWTVGKKIKPLPRLDKDRQWLKYKTEFLSRLGFVENSKEFRLALSVFRGKGAELQQRFNCFVEAGLDAGDVVKMARIAPQILNQKVDVLKRKIDFLVNDLGYPVQFLRTFPSYMGYTVERVGARFTMYNWLRMNVAEMNPASLRAILKCSDESFVEKYVMRHPNGPQVWERVKNSEHPVDKLN